MTSVFVGNIAWATSEQELGDAFAQYGEVNHVKIIQDRETGRSKGFGFVEFKYAENVQDAIANMDGFHIHNRPLRVNMANQRPQHNQQQGPPQHHQQQQQHHHQQQQHH